MVDTSLLFCIASGKLSRNEALSETKKKADLELKRVQERIGSPGQSYLSVELPREAHGDSRHGITHGCTAVRALGEITEHLLVLRNNPILIRNSELTQNY